MKIAGVIHRQRHSEAALDALRAAVDQEPESPQAHYCLADAQLACGQIGEASRHAAQAVKLGASGAAARELWGATLAASDELHTALVVLRAADSPARPPGEYLRTLGKRLARAGVRDHALNCFRLALEHNPDDREAAHLADALSGQNPAHPDPEYVRRHFDDFAAAFDQQLIDVLDYAGPRELKNATLATSTRRPPWEVLDLGCGTGLVAAELAGLAARIEGVDVAPKMIERARQRGLYASLTCDELLPALLASARTYDLVTAADVFIYVGKLDRLLAAVRGVLRPRGMLALTAEAAEYSALGQTAPLPGYWLEPTGRYSHSAAYLDHLAARNGFTIETRRDIALRQEAGRPVVAWLDVWSADA